MGLSDAMDFEHVITVHDDGTFGDGPAGLYAPTVLDVGDGARPDDPVWELLTGYTGQHGYNGPVMHPSEYIGGRMARDILDTPGVYVAVVVYADDEPDGPEPAGWAVARYVGERYDHEPMLPAPGVTNVPADECGECGEVHR